VPVLHANRDVDCADSGAAWDGPGALQDPRVGGCGNAREELMLEMKFLLSDGASTGGRMRRWRWRGRFVGTALLWISNSGMMEILRKGYRRIAGAGVVRGFLVHRMSLRRDLGMTGARIRENWR